MALTPDRRTTESGIEVKPVYGPDDAQGPNEPPGSFPFTRGPYPDMYRGRPWTMRQYAGFGSAEETNARFRTLLARGQTGLSVAFDLPTQLGYDSDDPVAEGEVGRTGVAIDSVDDMARLLEGIPLDEVSTSMTINAPAALLLLSYELVAEERGIAGDALRGTVQNDVLKEYVARGNYIFPPRPSMRLTTDLFAYCAERIPSWNTISISGYHIREAGSTAAQELAFTLANGIAYCEAAVAAGLSPDEFGTRLSFFFNAHNDVLQEVAKFRAARRLWARIMRDRFGATSPKAQALRFHAQTGGSTLTAQQPENNLVRVAAQALSAVYGGAQSIHTNGFDEALALPTERAATLALRTQQILMHEAGTTDTADPLGGSWYVESLTDELESIASGLIEQVDELGGAVAAIEAGWVQDQIEESAFRWQREVEQGERVIVGVNRFTTDEPEHVELHRLDPAIERAQRERTQALRARARRGRSRGARSPRCDASRPRTRTCCRPFVPRSRRARRSASSAVRSASSGARTTRGDDTYPSAMSARSRVAVAGVASALLVVAASALLLGGSASATPAAAPRLRPRRRADRPRDVRGLPPRRRDRPLRLPHRARPRESGRARGRRTRVAPDAALAAQRELAALRRSGAPDAGREGAGDPGRLGALAARPPRQRASGHTGRLAASGRHAAPRRGVAPRAGDGVVLPAVRGERGHGRLPLLPPRPEADEEPLRHRGADRARHRLARAPRDPVPHRSRLGRRGGRAGPQHARAPAGRASAARGSPPPGPGTRAAPSTMPAGSPRGRPGGEAIGCATARASRSRPEAGS